MRLERLSDLNGHFYDRAFSLYQSAFPREEKRDESEQARVMAKSDYHFDLILDGDGFLGVMLYWETDSFVFLEHFTTEPAVRGRGIGAAALELLKAKGKTVILEIEPPTDELTTRRYNFYLRSGFTMNSHHHIQAKYHLGDEDLELKIMSYPRAVTTEEYLAFYDYMTREIGIRPNIADGVTVRPLAEGDDLRRVARLIYLTDPYIYPYWFDSLEDGIAVIEKMIDLPTLYNRRNITVAVLDGEIAGAVVSCDCPFTEHLDGIDEAFIRAGVSRDERTDKIFKDYYCEMGALENGHYIANVAVAPEFRRRGVGAAMLRGVLADKEHCTLECVIANSGSWRLYQRFGFEIVKEYPGVFDVPCYKMVYWRRKI